MKDLISRKAAIANINKAIPEWSEDKEIAIDCLKNTSTAQPEIVRCKDCIYGFLYIDNQNGVIDSWIECRNPEGLNRDVSVDGYCSASIRRRTDEQIW